MIDDASWPVWARAAAQMREPWHRGVGDTIELKVGMINSAKVEEWLKSVTGQAGMQLVCPSKLNKAYPYEAEIKT